jgi:hypothetical protein
MSEVSKPKEVSAAAFKDPIALTQIDAKLSQPSEQPQNPFRRTEILIQECKQLTTSLAEYDDLKIPGARKFHNKLNKERQFLEKVLVTSASDAILNQKLNTSNISYLRGVLYKLKEELTAAKGEVLGLFRKFVTSHDNRPKKKQRNKSKRFSEIEVDIVSNSGKRWIKVKAQNPESLQHDVIAKEKGRTVVALARALSHHAALKPVHFAAPECVIYFASGVTPDVRKLVEDEGVRTEGETVQSSFSLFDDYSDEESYSEAAECKVTPSVPEIQEITAVNLDTTTLITFISDLTNGGGREFDSEILQVMAEDEQINPALPAIMQHLEGRNWIICETAAQCLRTLIQILAGEKEKARAMKLLARAEIVPDQRSSYIDKVKCSKLSERNKIIFGTGHTLRIPTVTSNGKLIRSAVSQGVDLYVLTHPARPLTEKRSAEMELKKTNRSLEELCMSAGQRSEEA